MKTISIFRQFILPLCLFLSTVAIHAQLQSVESTTAVNGEFPHTTVWYNLAIGKNSKVIGTQATELKLESGILSTAVSDNNLWCFIGNPTDGYKIYNKSTGCGKMLAAPSSPLNGQTEPMMAEYGQNGLVYEWMLVPSYDLGADTPSFYLQLKGYPTAILNDYQGAGSLKFWTAGRDSGSSVAIYFGQTVVDASPSTGKITNTNGQSGTWNAVWLSDRYPQLSFSNANNNMCVTDGHFALAHGVVHNPWRVNAPQGMEITGFEFDFKKSSDYAVEMTVSAGEYRGVATNEWQHLRLTGLDANSRAEFDVSGVNGNTVLLNNFRIAVRRSTTKFERTVVFRYDGVAPYNVVYRIPAITTVENGRHKGRLIAINDYRYCGADIGAGRIDLYQSVSDDNGATWTEPDHLRDASGLPVAQGNNTLNSDCAFGDAAIVSDRESGQVMMVAVGGHVNFFSGRRNNPNFCNIWYSYDGGETWSPRRDVTELILSLFDNEMSYGKIDSQFFGSGRMMQSRYVKIGSHYRVYAVLSSQNDGGFTRNWCLYTDDFGRSWNILGCAPCVTESADEPKAEELPDGSVLLAARRNGGNRNFNIFRYTDVRNGEGSWEKPLLNTDMGFGHTIAHCNGEIMIVPACDAVSGQRCYIALQSIPKSQSRTKVSIAYKVLSEAEDFYHPYAFSSWDGVYQVTPLPSGYSTMCLQHDNTIGFLYEEETFGKCYCGVYRNLTIDEITGGHYVYAEDSDFSVRKSLAVRLMDHRLAIEANTAEIGKYVGQLSGIANDEAISSRNAFVNSPTIENSARFNRALKDKSIINPQHRGVYRFISAHGGIDGYPTSDRYLCHDGELLTVTADANSCNARFIAAQRPDGYWIFKSENSEHYIGPTQAAVEKQIPIVTDSFRAGRFKLESDLEGRTTLICVNGGNPRMPALHMNKLEKVVIWTASANASQWHMEKVGECDDMSVITQVERAETNAPTTYFDLTGRRVDNPIKGSIYITGDHRKVIF